MFSKPSLFLFSFFVKNIPEQPEECPTEVNLPMLPLSPPWFTLKSHQSQCTHATFLPDETHMEDILDVLQLPEPDMFSIPQNQARPLWTSNPFENTHHGHQGLSSKCFTLQICSYCYSLFIKMWSRKREITVNNGSHSLTKKRKKQSGF